ncbi:tyrosine-type recombinase/integrase [Roseomonas populi]|uniref:Tyrosine-type recombinase/integrase n=1 Tax=Roseomonas populi TaxID=3121582 RepID=A0ABT1XEL0_9PROT|nr:tyrosine-type recombinase/integrase [Roseomonas pecuniae]MCR0985414.1 tyrosine-type recombinase/integrase [Roseomonas pecuniae]
MPTEPTNRRPVKSSAAEVSKPDDRHDRTEDFPTSVEVTRLLNAAEIGRRGVRNHLLMPYRQGVRVSKAVCLRWEKLDLERARLSVRHLKGGASVQQLVTSDGLLAIKRYLATRKDVLPSPFVSQRGQLMRCQAAADFVSAAAERAGLARGHPHRMRHSCGLALADKGHGLRLIQDYVSHRDLKHTVHNTRTAGRRFDGLWR